MINKNCFKICLNEISKTIFVEQIGRTLKLLKIFTRISYADSFTYYFQLLLKFYFQLFLKKQPFPILKHLNFKLHIYLTFYSIQKLIIQCANYIIFLQKRSSNPMMMYSKKKEQKDEFQQKIGIKFHQGSRKFTAFLTNFKTTSFKDKQDNQQKSALLCYFQDQDGFTHKLLYPFSPYFYVQFQPGMDRQIHSYLQTKIGKIQRIELVQKIDLQEVNHLSGRKKLYFKISFRTIKDLNNAKTPLKQMVDRRKKKINNQDNFSMIFTKKPTHQFEDIADLITGIRQYDVIYHSRVCIDTGLRAGKWFDLDVQENIIKSQVASTQKQSMPDLKILSYDIQTSKEPLKFPDAERNQVMMISLMYQGQAFLIINCGFCGHQVTQFYYEPKPQFACHVTVYNEPSQKAVLQRFANFIQSYKPSVITTFNGDRFDYPFIKTRCQINYIKFTSEMGVSDQGNQYYGNFISHLDCYCWVDRDAYLPQGSHGLKAVTKAKLNYDPIEVDPEDMVYMAKNNTQRLAQYAVSDAVATFYLYMKHIHGFIFALSTIIPMYPDQVLRKGSGTLCQSLLMVQAFNRNIIFPNKKMENFEKFYQGHLLDSQTYTGGKVQCLRTGVYRADFPTEFTLNPTAFKQLIENIQEIIKFAIDVQMPEQNFDDIINLQEVVTNLQIPLQKLKDVKNPSKFEAKPLIYHLDVAAMYPNIILTNRLQPVAIVNDRVCSGCLFNSPQNDCKRDLQWEWKGQVFPLNEGQYLQVKQKLAQKIVQQKQGTQDYQKKLKQQIKNYCQKIYKKVHISTSQIKTDTVCMRQNSFYVDTVRAFRDRRYDYKRKVKQQKGFVDKCYQKKDVMQAEQHKKLMALYESMQLAHKIILNSFYGYVMRKGARWYSMQTAAMVTFIGSNIISDSKNFIESRIGKPLELDTDGIWMLLPQGFPENVNVKFKSGKTFKLSYPCHILNHVIYQKYANPQYQSLLNQQKFQYKKTKQMTIFFQIDGPYKAMMIPAAKQKQKTTQLDIQQHSTQLLKKRYCVFNFKNQISQFKGFQMKRRGQLRITKVFQEEIFPQYLKGNNLKQCYDACAETAKKYIGIINKRGQGMDVDQILDYFQQSRVLSKDVKQYGESKGVAINSAKRLSQFLGPQVIKGKGGLCCYFVISALPVNRPVTQRAIPTQIFNADLQVQRQFLARWTKNDDLKNGEVDIKNILDWGYYFERLSTQIQKMVCIPAVLQNISNPVEQIQLPEWLQKKTFDMRHHKQEKIFAYGFGIKIGNQNMSHHKTPSKSEKKNQEDNQNENKNDRSQIKAIYQELRQQQRQIQKNQILGRAKKNPFSMNNNFSEWLVQQKKIWKQKKRQIVSFDTIKFQQLKSIIHIVPEKTPGSFNVWYHSGGKIQSLLINVKRRYYCKGDGVKKAPREQGDAVQTIIDEQLFSKNQDYFDCFLGKKFYETKLPLLTSLMIKKGNIWKINKALSTYTQQHIQQIFGQQYLPNIQDNFMPIVYLVRCKVAQSRVIWALINPKLKQYKFIFVDKSIKSSTDELYKLAKKIIGKAQAKIQILHKKTENQTGESVNQILNNYQNALKQPFLVVLQSQTTNQIKSYGVDMLQNDLPVICLKSITIQAQNVLDWKIKSIIKVLSQSDGVTGQIVKLLRWSRYSHIPICNLSTQKQLLNFITNVSLTRLLHTGDYLTWWNQYSSELITTYESSTYTGKIANPGLYKTFSIQIQIHDLAINTVANSDDLMMQDRDAALLMQKKNNSNPNASKVQAFDEMGKVKKSFQYVKKMIKIWIKDFQLYQNDEAQQLLKNFHKWISMRNNSLFDPLLLRIVNEFMKKVFYILMRRLSELGMKIISANFSKMIVATQKFRYNEALGSIDYVLQKCVQDNQKLFKYLKLVPLKPLYKAFLFRDPFNYIAITQNNEYSYQIDIENLLCKNVGKCFRGLLISFVQRLCIIKQKLQNEYVDNQMKLFLQYQKILDQQIIEFIQSDFCSAVVGIVRNLYYQWQNNRQNSKNDNFNTDLQSQNQSSQQEDQEDSFIDDGFVNQKQKKQQKIEEKQQKKLDVEWGQQNQLDTLIQNVFSWASMEQTYKDHLYKVRRLALRQLKIEPSIQNWIIKPVYPAFELPCRQCYMVNNNPGTCELCKQQLHCSNELQNAVWKMIQEQGRDVYCDRCNRIKQGFLKKCGCGGKWIFKQFPLQWVKYTSRKDKEWNFVNQIFDFMGIQQVSGEL